MLEEEGWHWYWVGFGRDTDGAIYNAASPAAAKKRYILNEFDVDYIKDLSREDLELASSLRVHRLTTSELNKITSSVEESTGMKMYSDKPKRKKGDSARWIVRRDRLIDKYSKGSN